MSVDARAVAIQGVGAVPRLTAVQGLAPAGGGPTPPATLGGLVYSPARAPFRPSLRDVVRW